VPLKLRLARMLEVAECLAAGLGHLRADVHDAAEEVRVGELTAYGWSGLEPFSQDADDLRLGAHWRLPALLWRRWGVPAVLR
jgi:hypothetical protein